MKRRVERFGPGASAIKTADHPSRLDDFERFLRRQSGVSA